MTSLEKYNNVMGQVTPTEYPRSYVFSPQDEDYKMPFVRRFFAKKINLQDIAEVDADNYRTISSSIYVLTSVKWKVSGSITSVYQNGILKTEGVSEYNKKQIQDAEKKMPGISSLLNNLLAGYKYV